jgi:hypothetical protein
VEPRGRVNRGLWDGWKRKSWETDGAGQTDSKQRRGEWERGKDEENGRGGSDHGDAFPLFLAPWHTFVLPPSQVLVIAGVFLLVSPCIYSFVIFNTKNYVC